VTFWGVTRRLSAVALVLAAACGGDDPEAAPSTSGEATTSTGEATTTTTAPERMPSTTTTAFDPASVEGEVEAAYLRSWDVYAQAVYDLELDEQALAEVYAGEGLANLRAELEGRIRDGRAALARVDHDYEIVISAEGRANVLDTLTNHQVLIDPATKAPIEDDPAEVQVINFVMEQIGDAWYVTLVQRIRA
jgi:hypothetical protein